MNIIINYSRRIALFVMILLSGVCFGQVTGGGSKSPQTQTKQPVKKETKGVQAFTLSLAGPMGKFNKYDAGASLEDAYGAAAGIALNWVFIGHQKELSNGLNIGLFMSSGLVVLPMDKAYQTDFDLETTPVIAAEFKIGSALTYELGNDIYIDTYFSLGPVVGVGADFGAGDFFPIGPFVSLKTALGAQIRLNKLVAGLSIHPGKVKMKYEDATADSFNSTNEFEYKVSISNFRLSVGFLI